MAEKGQIKTTADLRQMLIDTIEGVRNGNVDNKQASSVAVLSGKILQSAKLDLDVLRFNIANREAIVAGDKVLQLVNLGTPEK